MTKTQHPFLTGVVLLAVVIGNFAGAPAEADKFDSYIVRPEKQILFPDVALPEHAQGPTLFGAVGDGRIVAVTTRDGDESAQNNSEAIPVVHIQTAVGGNFTEVGLLPLSGRDWPDFGGSFLAISPSGSKVAVGNNAGNVAVFSASDLTPGSGLPSIQWFDVSNNAGAWWNDETLALTGFDGTGGVIVLNTTSAESTAVVQGIGASGGIAFDGEGNLYTGEGFSTGGKPTGQVRRFELGDWQAALGSGTPLNFQSETDGTDVVQFASSASLAFDDEGNLIVGGGRFDVPPAESNGLGIYRPVDGALRVLDPSETVGNFYNVAYNQSTGEIYANEPFSLAFGVPAESRVLHVVSIPGIAVPEPGAWLLMALGMSVLLRFYISRRRIGVRFAG